MLEDFNKKCLERGNIVSTDTLIITINARALAKIADEGDNLYKSVSDLVLYATGAAACSTSDLILVLSSINQSLDNIKKHLNKAYFDTWKYIGNVRCIVLRQNRRLSKVLLEDGKELATSDISS